MYAESLKEDLTPQHGTEMNVTHLRRAFAGTPAAKPIIDRCYHGNQPYNRSNIDFTPPPNDAVLYIHGKVLQVSMRTDINGPDITSFSASDNPEAAWLLLRHTQNVAGGPYEVPINVVTYFQDGHVSKFGRINLSIDESDNRSTWTRYFSVGSDQDGWAVGRYCTMVYDPTQKIAQVEWAVTP